MTRKQIDQKIAVIQSAIQEKTDWLDNVKSAKPSEVIEAIQYIDYLQSMIDKARSLKSYQN